MSEVSRLWGEWDRAQKNQEVAWQTFKAVSYFATKAWDAAIAAQKAEDAIKTAMPEESAEAVIAASENVPKQDALMNKLETGD